MISVLRGKNDLKFGTIYTNGAFLQKEEYLKSTGEGLIKIMAKGEMCNIVAKSLIKKPITIKIYSNNNKNSEKNTKNNQQNKISIKIINPRLYTIMESNNNNNNSKVLEIETSKGLAIYSFSFQ